MPRCACRAFTLGTTYIAEVDIVLPEDMPLKEAHDIGGCGHKKLVAAGAVGVGRDACLGAWGGCMWSKSTVISLPAAGGGALSAFLPAGESLQIKLELLPEVSRAYVHLDYETTHVPEHKH